ncbi:hypothetical protein D3C84_1212610 [compost metagenome]
MLPSGRTSLASSRYTSLFGVSLRSVLRLAASNDWMNTGAALRFSRYLVSAATSGCSSARPCCWCQVGCLVSG